MTFPEGSTRRPTCRSPGSWVGSAEWFRGRVRSLLRELTGALPPVRAMCSTASITACIRGFWMSMPATSYAPRCVGCGKESGAPGLEEPSFRAACTTLSTLRWGSKQRRTRPHLKTDETCRQREAEGRGQTAGRAGSMRGPMESTSGGGATPRRPITHYLLLRATERGVNVPWRLSRFALLRRPKTSLPTTPKPHRIARYPVKEQFAVDPSELVQAPVLLPSSSVYVPRGASPALL